MNLTEICLNFCFHTLLLFVSFRPKASENQNVGFKTSETRTKTCLFRLGSCAGRELGSLLLQPGRREDQELRFGADTWPPESWGLGSPGLVPALCPDIGFGRGPTAAPLAEENVQGN